MSGPVIAKAVLLLSLVRAPSRSVVLDFSQGRFKYSVSSVLHVLSIPTLRYYALAKSVFSAIDAATPAAPGRKTFR